MRAVVEDVEIGVRVPTLLDPGHEGAQRLRLLRLVVRPQVVVGAVGRRPAPEVLDPRRRDVRIALEVEADVARGPRRKPGIPTLTLGGEVAMGRQAREPALELQAGLRPQRVEALGGEVGHLDPRAQLGQRR